MFLDSDEDALDDLREMIEGTDPYDADTDGDGVSDGAGKGAIQFNCAETVVARYFCLPES